MLSWHPAKPCDTHCQVRVEWAPRRIGVWLLDTKLLAGMLAQDIKVEESTWFIGKKR